MRHGYSPSPFQPQAEANPTSNPDWMKKLTKRKWTPASNTDREWQYSKQDTLQFEKDKVRVEELVFVEHNGRIYGRYIAIPPDGDYSKYRERFKEKFKELAR